MTAGHDPTTQVGYLQTVLSQDKKPLGFLLGAGCPLSIRNADGSPLIPDIEGLTEAVRTALGDPADLKIATAHFEKDGHPAPDIEALLGHIRKLKSVAGNDSVRGLTYQALDKLDTSICDAIHDIANKSLSSTTSPYHSLAAWCEAGIRTLPVEIFTINYDLLLEQALEDSQVPFFDGFVGAKRPFFDLRAMEQDSLPPRWVRLWKLHGSINWFQDDATRRVGRIQGQIGAGRRVIHPSHLKYDESRRLPYLAMLDRLRAYMKQPSSTLITCGYSFRDEHINEMLVQGLESNPSAMVFALMFEDLAKNTPAATLALERFNLSVLAKDGAVIGRRKAVWIERTPNDGVPSVDWISWMVTPESKDTLVAAFLLGDFEKLGALLQSLIRVHSSVA